MAIDMSESLPPGSFVGILPAGAPSQGEVVPPEEAAAVQAIVASISERVRAAAQGAPARRDAHVKAHGCVRATFTVLDDLPASLRVGVFAAPRAFEAVIRFSNGNETPQPDRIGDGRGMAIKLLGVADSVSGTQDFLTINNPAFFVRNAADYVDFQTASPPWRFFFPGFNPFNFRFHELAMARAITAQTVTNPLNVRYWSMVPFLCGTGACKYSARPAGTPSSFVATDTDNYLHDNLAAHLAQGAAEFDFLIQLQTDPASMPIEDPTIIWPEDAAPFAPVARIVIPQQTFDSPEQHAFCENLSFTPWHSRPAHRPLGGINRVRRTVYETISRLRHDLNNAPRQEPVATTP
jgi:Catalase